MALAILDGNQAATNLSTILTSGEHITAHTIVSLGTQAKTDILAAVSSGISISVGSALPTGTNRIGVVTIGAGTVTIGAGTAQIGSVTASISGTVPVSGTFYQTTQPVSLATIPSLVAGTAQIGSVTASISGTVPVSGTFYQATQPVTLTNTTVTVSSLPAISGTVTANTGLTQPLTNTELRASSINVSISQPSSLSRVGVNLVDASGTGNYGTSGSALNVAGTVTVGNTVTIAGTVTANPTGTQTIAGTVTASVGRNSDITAQNGDDSPAGAVNIGFYSEGDSEFRSVKSSAPLPVIANGGDFASIAGGSMPAKAVAIGFYSGDDGGIAQVNDSTRRLPISGTVTIGSLPAIRINPNYDGQSGNNGPVVEADSNLGDDPRYMVVAGGFDNNSQEFRALTFGSGSTLLVGGTVTASLAISSTAITKGSFTSLTSATLVPANTARKMATVYNLGAGQLFVNAGATCTTLGGGFMVKLSSGDFYECNYTTTTLSAIFATAGTASWISH
jgi:hypothetical protein